jgi:asparagine synthase (glutamine-hydrolysing)
MCGVCGIAAPGGRLDGEWAGDQVRAMVDALAHRGPDDAGVREAPGAVLGATRLAIRGLADGRQPMVDPASGVVAVCNGEIDNHAELAAWLAARGRPVASRTDVAVVPGLYAELGEAFVERLAGVFAIAIWDPRGSRLLLARDRAGERPLFYWLGPGTVRFATELSALGVDAGLRLTPDRAALGRYVRFGYFTAPATPFTEVRKVAPGELVVIEADRLTRRRYWRWTIPGRDRPAPTLPEFDAVFREAVRRQSDAEVECGVFLSGGLDSSLVAAVAKALAPGRRLRAYTLRFAEASYDEGGYAERTAARLGLEWCAVPVTPEALREGLADLVRTVGEPLADPAWVPTALLARRASRDVKLALVGEGADELFGGYPTYVGATLAERYARLPGPVRALLRAAVERWPPSDRKVTVSYLLKRFVAAADRPPVDRHRHWTSSVSPELLARLGVSAAGAEDDPGDGGGVLDVLQRMDLETSLAEGLLTKADRASMSSALELRAPYLDQAVMELAAALPPEQRVRGLTTKVFLKRYAERYLPADIVRRRKRGLSVPLARWLRGPLHAWAADRLGAARLRLAGIDPDAAGALLEDHRRRRGDHARALWTLIVLSEWLAWLAAAPAAGDAAREGAG